MVNESHVESSAIEWFQQLDYAFVHGLEIPLDETAAERESFDGTMICAMLPLRDLPIASGVSCDGDKSGADRIWAL